MARACKNMSVLLFRKAEGGSGQMQIMIASEWLRGAYRVAGRSHSRFVSFDEIR